jgi:DNA-binding Lrp family transcriptional regulator
VSKIDEINSKILKDLLYDGRKGFTEIAKECGVTKNKIWKRYKAMENNGIITGATIQINFAKLGYDSLATLLINVEAQLITEAMKYIGKITEVHASRQYNSVYNVRAVANLNNLNELDQVKQAIKRKLPVMGLKTYIWTDVRNIPENLNFTCNPKKASENSEPSSKTIIQTPIDRIEIDELDRQIMEKLTLYGRASFTEIAQEIGTATDTIVKRYHKLKKNGAMKVSIQINPNIIGYNSILDFSIACTSSGNLPNSVIESLAKIPDVINITKTSGDYDLQLIAMIKDTQQSFALQDQIAKISRATKMEVSARKIPNKWPTPRQHISTY